MMKQILNEYKKGDVSHSLCGTMKEKMKAFCRAQGQKDILCSA